MGGGGENDEAMKWFLYGANGGDVVVLRTSGSDGYNDYMYTDLGVGINSVETFVCHNRQASYDSTLLKKVAQAEAIWFAGGDQWTYVSYWRDTPLDSLINTKIQNENYVIGGISAGMAILGQYYFSAENGTISSDDAVNNPYDSRITVETTPFIQIPLLENILTETHLDNPNRRGRIATFMARLIQDHGIYARVIACSDYAAVCISGDGTLHVQGDYPNYDDNAHFVLPNCAITNNVPEQISPNLPLLWTQNQEAIKVCRVQGLNNVMSTFDLNSWTTGSPNSQWNNWYLDSAGLWENPTTEPVCPTGIEVPETVINMRLYPSPSRDIMHLELSSDEVQDFYTLSNTLGQSILQGKIEHANTLIPVAQLMPGVYTLTVLSKKGQPITQRFYVYR